MLCALRGLAKSGRVGQLRGCSWQGWALGEPRAAMRSLQEGLLRAAGCAKPHAFTSCHALDRDGCLQMRCCGWRARCWGIETMLVSLIDGNEKYILTATGFVTPASPWTPLPSVTGPSCPLFTRW